MVECRQLPWALVELTNLVQLATNGGSSLALRADKLHQCNFFSVRLLVTLQKRRVLQNREILQLPRFVLGISASGQTFAANPGLP